MTRRTVPVDVLIPTNDRPDALAVTLTALSSQDTRGFRVVVSDQSVGGAPWKIPSVATAIRVLRHTGVPVEVHERARRGVAEQRAFLLAQSRAPQVLFLDDDVLLRPHVVRTLSTALVQLGCGFVGMAVQGLSYEDDVRPHQQETYEEWTGAVRPERVVPGSAAWARSRLHNAANLVHIAARLGLAEADWRPYKIAWVGGCVLYRRQALLDCGGFDFWRQLPERYCGEDVLAQLRVMARYGGAGILPTAAFHQELPTTIPDRDVEAYDVIGLPVTGMEALR